MTVKEAKEHLRTVERLNTCADQKLAELADLRTMMGTVKSLDYSKEHVQTSPVGEAPYIAGVERLILLDEEVNREIDRFVDERHKVINEVQALPNHTSSQILFKRYVEFKNFYVISEEMGYSYSHVLHLHGRALEEFARMMSAQPGAGGSLEPDDTDKNRENPVNPHKSGKNHKKPEKTIKT